MPKKTTDTTIPKLQQLFAQYGPAKQLFTDNGQPFFFRKFTAYMMHQQVQHITHLPHYSQSNGLPP